MKTQKTYTLTNPYERLEPIKESFPKDGRAKRRDKRAKARKRKK